MIDRERERERVMIESMSGNGAICPTVGFSHPCWLLLRYLVRML